MEKNLLCAESFCSEDKMADKDNVILDDNRVLDHLLQTEVIYMPQIHSKNSDLDPTTRKIVTKWMLEVCEEEACLGPVFPLAVNFLDRFLCKCDVPKKFLQLVAADCLLIASKIRQSSPISINTLCYYTDNSVTPCQLRNFETLLATKLKWDLAAVTAFDFIDQILQRVTWCNSMQEKIVRVHSVTLINLCCTDYEFLNVKPSVIAAASIMSAMVGIRIKIDSDHLKRLCSLIKANPSEVEKIASKIERIVNEEMSHLNKPVSKMVDSNTSLTCYDPLSKYSGIENEPKKPETPVDVQNANF